MGGKPADRCKSEALLLTLKANNFDISMVLTPEPICSLPTKIAVSNPIS